MLHKMLDRLLAMHFKEPSTNNKLDRLEQDVWSKIHSASAEMIMPWYDKMMLAFAVPQFRMASLAMALVIGISISPVLTPGMSTESQDTLGMDVFTSRSPYLADNLIGQAR